MNELVLSIPAAAAWGSLAVGIVAALGWAFYHERRIGKMLTRAEHDAICAKNQKEVTTAISKISSKLDEQDFRAQEHREKVAATLATVVTQIENIKERVNQPPPQMVETVVQTRVRPRRRSER